VLDEQAQVDHVHKLVVAAGMRALWWFVMVLEPCVRGGGEFVLPPSARVRSRAAVHGAMEPPCWRVPCVRYRQRMGDSVDLVGLLEAVHDRASFLEFVSALALDRREELEIERATPSALYSRGARGWENSSIEGFLEAAVSWAKDVHQLQDERAAWFPEAPSWGVFARFLYLGKIYE
jgi:hypothetical protein